MREDRDDRERLFVQVTKEQLPHGVERFAFAGGFAEIRGCLEQFEDGRPLLLYGVLLLLQERDADLLRESIGLRRRNAASGTGGHAAEYSSIEIGSDFSLIGRFGNDHSANWSIGGSCRW